MAKSKKNTMTMIIILAAVGIIGYILYKSNLAKGREGSGEEGESGDLLPQGCYPLEEVHELSVTSSGSAYDGQMWVSIIPYNADGSRTIRPPKDSTSIGESFTISNTGSALDQSYTILGFWYDAEDKIGAMRVDVPGGYNFNYNATQGEGTTLEPRDMTYFGVGRICFTQ